MKTLSNIIFIGIVLILSNSSLLSQVHTTYLWHMQQPTYWPDQSQSNPYTYQKVWESYQLKQNGTNTYPDGLAHPLNDLEEIFSKSDRVNAYQWETRNAINSILAHPDAGAQVNYGGCLIENIQSLSDAGAWGYASNWASSVIEAQNWQTSGGAPRMDVTAFTWHHSLSPLVSDQVLRKEIQGHRHIVENYFNGSYSKGYFPAECSFSERIIPVLIEEGLEWTVVANSHLARTLDDYPLNFGTSGCNIDPPNKADMVTTSGNNWWNGQIDGRGGTFAAPYCYQAHKAQYVDAETGQVHKMTVVPMADLLSYKDGFSEQSTAEVDNNLAPYDDPNHPSIVLLCHDGDNAWGGGASYYQQAVPNFSNAAANQGYSPTTIQQFLNDHPVPESDVVKVEDGSWVNAANDWGHPQFLNWIWPMYTSDFEFDPNGWTEDARNWAVLTAAENYVVMAEDLEGNLDISDIVNPSANSSNAELAWNALLPGYTSGYMYYGKAIDMEIKQTVAANNAIPIAQNVINANAGIDNTAPSVFIPQRYPYNPGEIGFGPNYGYQQHLNSADFTVWTFAHDVNGIASATLKYRVDNDGVNPIANHDNETYAGGNGVAAWQSLSMTERVFPKTNITDDPEIDFFILPQEIANEYYAEIQGLSEVLVDYYVEMTDTYGNVHKSKIQHVWVGENLDVNPSVSFSPGTNSAPTSLDVTIEADDSTDPNPTLYYTTDGSEPTTSSSSASGQVIVNITETTTFKVFAVDMDGNISDVETKTYFIGEIPEFSVYFKAPAAWSSPPNIYWWDNTPQGPLEHAPWPGEQMTATCDGWYSYTFTAVSSPNLIFNDGQGSQTTDLIATGEAYYDGTVMDWVSNPTVSTPCLDISPTGGTYSSGSVVDVTLSADNATIYYTMDGSTPTTSSPSATNAITLPISSNTTLKAFAQDATNASDILTEVYEFEELDGFIVYFKPSATWSGTPNIYWWNNTPEGPLEYAPWPGEVMTAVCDGWYSYTFIGENSPNIVFNDNQGNQTTDLEATSEAYYDGTIMDWIALPNTDPCDPNCPNYDSCNPNCPDYDSCICIPENCPSCNDGIQNGNETDIDCGGPDCPACSISCEVNGDLFVDIAATGANDGSSWADAFTDLQSALAIGIDKKIHIAEGLYLPTSTGARGASFNIPDGANIQGGYPPGGGDINIYSYTTTLSGEIDGVEGLAGNSYHVVKAQNVSCVTIDGITIKHGNATDVNSFGRSRGAGIYAIGSEIILSNSKVVWNKAIKGGGAFASLCPNITIFSTEFSNNTADNGSALYHSNQTNMYIIRSRILNNNSLERSAIEVNNSLYTKMENSIIANNPSKNANAIALIATNRSQTIDVYNSTILGETKNKNLITLQIGFGDQLDANFYNSIIAHQNLSFFRAFKDYNNGVLNLHTENCYIQGNSVIGTSVNNLYSSTAGDLMLDTDYSVNECSPVVNAGNDALVSGSIDVGGNNRFFGIVDIGAYEAQVSCGTAARESKDFSVIVSPNPTNGALNIQTLEEDIRISIFDVLGKRMIDTSLREINISSYPSGIYILNIEKNGAIIHVEKLVKK